MVFLTDNGPAFPRYNAGLRDLKGSVYEGGIRVPCYVRWPGHFPAGIEVDRVAAHIDLVPTLLEACDIPAGDEPKLDGRSLLPLLRGDRHAPWPDRTLYFQWHRGDAPEPGRAFAARSQSFKLLRPEARAGNPQPPLELYDIEHDPFEKHDLAASRPEVVAAMYRDYLALVPRRLRDARIRTDPDRGGWNSREPDAPDSPGQARAGRGRAGGGGRTLGTPGHPGGALRSGRSRPREQDRFPFAPGDRGSLARGAAQCHEGQPVLLRLYPERRPRDAASLDRA